MRSTFADMGNLQRIRVSESATAAERVRERTGAIENSQKGDGTLRIRIITEGKGSSGNYSAELIHNHSEALDGFKSFFDHPEYSFAPEERSVLKLAGRLVPGTLTVGKTEEGLAAAYADFKPREEYREFIQEFADVLGVSIYVAATFSEGPDGSRNVESFDRHDPYGSVDIVVAAGRGGRFEQARESLQTIESSTGHTGGNKPGAEASAQEKEGSMLTKEDVAAIIAEHIKPLVTTVSELKTAATEKATAEANAEAVTTAVTEARKSVAESLSAIADEPDLLDSQRTALTESAVAGEDITKSLESAKAIAAEAKTHFGSRTAEDAAGFSDSGDRTSEGADDSDFFNSVVEGKR